MIIVLSGDTTVLPLEQMGSSIYPAALGLGSQARALAATADRGAHESGSIRERLYLELLASRGVPVPELALAWDAYREALVHGSLRLRWMSRQARPTYPPTFWDLIGHRAEATPSHVLLSDDRGR